MPYIAFDLDALNNLPDAARAARLEEATIALGLLRMWRWCWREKKDTINRGQVRGFFGVGDDVAEALANFGFLETIEADAFRVRGADRYLRIRTAQAEAGRQKSTNLKKGKKRSNPETEPEKTREPLPAPLPANPEVDPEVTRALRPALTSSIEQLETGLARAHAHVYTRSKESATQTSAALVARVVRSAQEPSLKDRLEAAWLASRGSKYVWHGFRDGEALRDVLKAAGDDWDRIEKVWCRALTMSFPRCLGVTSLAQNWATYEGSDPPTQRRDPAAARAAERDWSVKQKTILTADGHEELDLMGDS